MGAKGFVPLGVRRWKTAARLRAKNEFTEKDLLYLAGRRLPSPNRSWLSGGFVCSAGRPTGRPDERQIDCRDVGPLTSVDKLECPAYSTYRPGGAGAIYRYRLRPGNSAPSSSSAVNGVYYERE